MNYKVEKKIICEETGEKFCVGDTVSIRYPNGGGNGCCEIAAQGYSRAEVAKQRRS